MTSPFQRPLDNQDKQGWAKYAAELLEPKAIERLIREYGIPAILNPEKHTNPYAPDLLFGSERKLGDLKIQNTPFFMAQKLYQVDPQYCATFNDKDGMRYRERYPNILIIFVVDWQTTSYTSQRGITYEVEPMRRVYIGTLDEVRKAARARHLYTDRKHDTKGNAKESWLIDLRMLTELKPKQNSAA